MTGLLIAIGVLAWLCIATFAGPAIGRRLNHNAKHYPKKEHRK